MTPTKRKRHLETFHTLRKRKFFIAKLISYEKQKSVIKKTEFVKEKALLASYKVVYQIVRCKQPHTIENLNKKAKCIKKLGT